MPETSNSVYLYPSEPHTVVEGLSLHKKSNENNENNENNETNENNESNANNNMETKTVYKSSNGNIKKSVTITPIVSSYTNNLNMVNEILNDPNSSYWDMIKEVL